MSYLRTNTARTLLWCAAAAAAGCLGTAMLAGGATLVLMRGGSPPPAASAPVRVAFAAVPSRGEASRPTPTSGVLPPILEEDYCRHIALATLASCQVECDHNEIRFTRDLRRPGSALEQFAELFGEAVRLRRSPDAPEIQFETPDLLATSAGGSLRSTP